MNLVALIVIISLPIDKAWSNGLALQILDVTPLSHGRFDKAVIVAAYKFDQSIVNHQTGGFTGRVAVKVCGEHLCVAENRSHGQRRGTSVLLVVRECNRGQTNSLHKHRMVGLN